MELDKLTTRADKASAAKQQLENSVKELEAEAAERAIIVLKEYYEGSLLQVTQHSAKGGAKAKGRQPAFGSARGDAGSSIISVLEMAAEDFTKTYTDIESEELEAARSYETLSKENAVSRAAKKADIKSKQSEVKSLTVAIENHKMDGGLVQKELDSVVEYLEKLMPQCETKVMSYEEKKQKREAEIDGLKEALGILDGGSV